jgi:hypothetical protein
LHSFTQLNTYQTDPTVPIGPNDQEHSLGQQGNELCTTKFNVQHLKALLISKYRINAFQNKYNRKACKLSSTPTWVHNKPKEQTNTPRAIIDLELCIYN